MGVSDISSVPASPTPASPAPSGSKTAAAKSSAARVPAEKAKPHYHDHRERMRDRLIAGDADGFLDYELLEYVLGFGRRDSTKELAKDLIAKFGSLPAVLAAESPALKGVRGLGDTGLATLKFVRACAVRMLQKQVLNRPVLSSWRSVEDYLHASMGHIIHEQFRVLFLNNKNILIADEVLGDGTVNHAPVYVRDIIKRALELGATALVLVHNHPSGDPKPSRDDIAMTQEIVEAARRLGISVHDHVIVAGESHASFKSLGLL
jgi:DNA repair protein RadC